jgi:hypothetical protein
MVMAFPNGIILFLQWEVLHVLGSVGDAEEIEVGKLFRACLAWAGRKSECRKYGIGRILRS